MSSLHETIAFKRLFAVCKIYVTIFPTKVSFRCAKFRWHSRPETAVFRVPDLHNNIYLDLSLYLVPVFPKNVCAPCGRFAWHNCRKTTVTVFQIFVTIFHLKLPFAVCQVCMTQLPSNVCLPCARFTWQYFTKRFLFPEPSLHDTVALKRLFAVCQICVIIFPLNCLCTVCQAYVTQLP